MPAWWRSRKTSEAAPPARTITTGGIGSAGRRARPRAIREAAPSAAATATHEDGGGMRSITFVQGFQYWLKLTAVAVPALVLAGH